MLIFSYRIKNVSYSNMRIRIVCTFLEFMRILAFPSRIYIPNLYPIYIPAIFQNAHKNRWMEMQLVTALKYETKMFQKFITCLFDNSYISYLGLCICFIFCKALLDPVFHVIAMQRFDLKNSIIAIQLFLYMILNLYLSSV